MEESSTAFHCENTFYSSQAFRIENIGDMMEPIAAGLAAWLIELAVAGTMFYGLSREEKKVIAGRTKAKS